MTLLQKGERTDTLHGCLSDERRRHVLSRLATTEHAQALADLAEYVAGREANVKGVDLDRETVHDVYVDLYHTHVPMLEAADLVEYDRDDAVVVLTEYPGDLIDEQVLADG